MEIYDRIKSRREMLNLSQMELAETLGYKSRSSIAKIEAGVNDLPQSKIKAFADALETTPSYLMGWTDDPYNYDLDPDNRFAQIPKVMVDHWKDIYGDDNGAIWRAWESYEKETRASAINNTHTAPSNNILPNAVPYNPTHRIPILGRISAGRPIYAEENIEGYIYTELNHGGEYFALRVNGDSMNAAHLVNGSIVVVRKQDFVDDGEIAVVLVGDDEATVKRFYHTDNIVTLMPQSTNPEHQPQIYDLKNTNIRIIGKVAQTVISY